MTKREILLASISGLLMSLAFPNLNLVYFLDLPYSADYRSFQKQSGKRIYPGHHHRHTLSHGPDLLGNRFHDNLRKASDHCFHPDPASFRFCTEYLYQPARLLKLLC